MYVRNIQLSVVLLCVCKLDVFSQHSTERSSSLCLQVLTVCVCDSAAEHVSNCLCEVCKLRCFATPNCCSQQQVCLRVKNIENDSSFTWTRLGIWEDRRPLNSSVFSVGPLLAEAEWNWVTSVLMAFSRSEN